jgi:hypothetical protein
MNSYILIGITLTYFRFKKATNIVNAWELLKYILLWPAAVLLDW